MAERIAARDMYIPAAQWQAEQLREMGLSYDTIITRLAAATKKSVPLTRKLMEAAVGKALNEQGTASLSPLLRAIIDSGNKNLQGVFENLTRASAGSGSKQYINALDRAYMQVATGAFDRVSATTNAIRDLTNSGITAITYKTGKKDYIDVAVTRAVRTGVNQTAIKAVVTRAEEIGTNLVEVTAHSGARTGAGIADHAAWQGKVYSLKGGTERYPNLADKTGYGTGAGLGGWNCRHSFFPFYEGISEPAYTQAELDALNDKKFTYNGHDLTEYEATQVQRANERKIRRYTREENAFKAAGDTGKASEARAKLRQARKEQSEFLEATGLKRQYERERVIKSAPVVNSSPNNGLTNAPKPFIMNMGKLTNGLGQNHADAMRDILDNAPDSVKAVWNKYADRMNIVNAHSKAAFCQQVKGVSFDIDMVSKAKKIHNPTTGILEDVEKPYETAFHEFGHNISALMAQDKTGWTISDIANEYESKLFTYRTKALDVNGAFLRDANGNFVMTDKGFTLSGLLKEEGGAYVNNVWDGLKADAKAKGLKATSVRKFDAWSKIKNEVLSEPILSTSDVSDMWGGLSKNSIGLHYGHETSYWNYTEVGVEAFAEMFSATAMKPEGVVQIKRYFPKSYKLFEEIMSEMGV
ncbi:hypothetical protein FACS189490_04050 [Clostridia bacterium]|nr:hypothetical protein FACS189490_04050 [Clostridia bacterium]